MTSTDKTRGNRPAGRQDRLAGRKDRLAGLDTLRAVAIVAVMLYHLNWRLPESFAWTGKVGWMGVDLFFVLSGYLIGSQLLRDERISLRNFYRKRAYRILPAYLVVLALYALWPAWREAEGMSPWWQFLTFTENLFVDYSRNQAFSHVWSLCVEEHFYLLLPLLVLWLGRKASVRKTVVVMLLLVAFGMAVRGYELVHVLRPLGPEAELFSVRYIERMYYPTWSRLDGLLAGVALALIRAFRAGWWAVLVRWANALLFCGVAVVGFSVWLFYDRFSSVTGAAAVSSVVGFPLLSLGLAMMVASGAQERSWLGRFRVPGAKMLATLAFSLYLTHKEVAHLVHERLPKLAGERNLLAFCTYAVGCLVVAAVLYVCVERPFLWLRDRRREVDFEARREPAI